MKPDKVVLATKQLDQLYTRKPAHFRYHIFNRAKPIRIFIGSKVTTETRRQADSVFDKLKLKGYKLEEKRRYVADILHATKRAIYHNGCILIIRRRDHPDFTPLRLQVIDKMVAQGYLHECRSLPGSEKMSRGIPTIKLHKNSTEDPWTFDPEKNTQYVFLRRRTDKEELPFNKNDETAATYQKMLTLANSLNSRYKITYRKWDQWSNEFVDQKRLRPILYAVFSDTFDQQGRMYTGKYGHQSLRKIERHTICFDGMGSIELDYVGMHARMLYHLEEIDFQDDPYALWGKDTTGPMRLLAKQAINTLINAKNEQAAISSCNSALSTKTRTGQKKQGKALEQARKLYDAWKETDLKFASIVALAKKQHKRIAKHFGQDMGIHLMRSESAIALEIINHFASEGIPILPNHDSFITPHYAKPELQRLMLESYHRKFDYFPIINNQ